MRLPRPPSRRSSFSRKKLDSGDVKARADELHEQVNLREADQVCCRDAQDMEVPGRVRLSHRLGAAINVIPFIAMAVTEYPRGSEEARGVPGGFGISVFALATTLSIIGGNGALAS